jgi:hypothetical protein
MTFRIHNINSLVCGVDIYLEERDVGVGLHMGLEPEPSERYPGRYHPLRHVCVALKQ